MSGGQNADPAAALEEFFHAYEQAKVFADEFQSTFLAERQRSQELQATLAELQLTLEDKERYASEIEESNRLLAERTDELGRLFATLEATPDFVGISDVEGRVQFLNRAARRMTGVEDDQELGSLRLFDFQPDWVTAIRFYDASTLVVFESGNRRVIEQSVREALENDGLILYAQPIKNLKSESVHWEVLARMKLPDGSIIGPDAFLPVAERSGLIHALDRAVVSKAIDVLAQREAANTPIHLAVNLSAKAFDDPELLPLISERIRATGLSPASIMFEITETATITNVLKAQEFLRYLRALGCKFAIDDFGVGLSSYYYLKIDGSFIRNLPNDTADQHLVKSMVEMACGLGKETVAEFVGDQATLDLLRELGVDHGQGYFLGKPGPIDDVLAQGGRDSEAA